MHLSEGVSMKIIKFNSYKNSYSYIKFFQVQKYKKKKKTLEDKGKKNTILLLHNDWVCEVLSSESNAQLIMDFLDDILRLFG